ncbi:MAG: ArsA family ATPase [Deltaproteobacteria bacterium]|nr:ArsA family ATPase [Deltaproteobacteria bacterium]MBW2307524.1 ArsA family ATPase [Deltaproteobacteria bacterium]
MRSLLHNKHIIVICGSGGVGKTTLSSALALMGAMEGKRSLVLTVDPARRLAQAMGLRKLDDRVRPISSSVFSRAGLCPAGSLSAVMLDTRRTFDRIIERTAPSSTISARIMANPFYDHMAGFMAGSHEYMAMEKLLEFHQSGEYELLVLDTPPTRHALDFLDAPKRMLDFLDDSVVRWFVKPSIVAGHFPLKILGKGVALHLGALERFTGIQVLGDLAEFFGNFSSMHQGFKERAAQVRELFVSDSTAFVLVTAPDHSNIAENRFFCQRLVEEGIPLSCVVFNRVRVIDKYPEACGENPGVEELYDFLAHNSAHTTPDIKNFRALIEKLRENYTRYCRLAEIDSSTIQALQQQLPAQLPTVLIPLFEEHVHNLQTLYRLGKYLVNDSADHNAIEAAQ